MAVKIRFLLFRDGRYYARRIVPTELRPIIGKNELREPLGADRRRAIEQLPVALVKINALIDHARAAQYSRNGADRAYLAAKLAPMAASELARTHYNEQLALDDALRNSGSGWAKIGINDAYVFDLRAASAGTLNDAEIVELLGSFINRYYLRGNITAAPNTPEWRQYARALADAELEVLARMFERDEGASYSTNHPVHLAPRVVEDVEEPFVAPVSLRGLLDLHLTHLVSNGGGISARKSWTPVFEDLLQFLQVFRGLKGPARSQADDARRLTADELIAWRDVKLQSLSAKTVKDVWMASVKSVLARAVEDRKLPSNPAKEVKVRLVTVPKVREKGFTDGEAEAVLRLCLRYAPPIQSNTANRESAHVTAAKRWGPWLCAFSGARVSEILQLRKSDIQVQNGINFLHITPEAGSVKGKSYRDVPLHQQLLDLRFLDFVEQSPDGPLFFSHTADPAKLPAQAVGNRVAKWLRLQNIIPTVVQPNHGWRHRFKTLSINAENDPRVTDSIQGHTGRTASDGYGDVTLAAKKRAIDRLARYSLE